MDILIYSFAFSIGFNLFLYAIAYFLQTDKITDISYCLTFVILSAFSLFHSKHSIIDIIFFIAVLIWGLRLGAYLFHRIHKIGRDQRFDKIRINPVSFLFFWIMQGLTCFIVLIPIILAHANRDKEFNFVFVLGIVIAGIGFLIESIADHQKFKFKMSNPNQFMKEGLWGFVQHPNYLGDLLFWWGIFIASIPFINWYVAIISPVWMSFIIIKFSGIPILQKKWKAQYGSDPGFQKYQKTTKKMIPFLY